MLGTVVPAAGLHANVRSAWLGRHRLREGHGHVHGANLGIRGSTYVSLGGWASLATGEDVALARRASQAGHVRVARTATIPVRTSSRLVGRTNGDGFAGFLRELQPLPEAS